MTEQQRSPGTTGQATGQASSQPTNQTTSQIGGIRAHANFQAIDATFFNLTDTEGRATAGLMVLLDRLHRPVRAELHFYEEIDGFMRDNTVRQAQLLLQDRYYSREPVTLRIMYVFQDRNTYDVTLPKPESAPLGAEKKGTNWAKIAGIVALIALVLALAWAASRWLGSGSDSQMAELAPSEPAAAPLDTAAVEDEAAADQAASEPTPILSQDLPESRNADNSLAVGMRVVVLPRLQSYIRSEPDATAGENVGIFQDGDAGLLTDGPILRPGTSDTIVWWYIVGDDGDEGWVPANTSELTLLAPEE